MKTTLSAKYNGYLFKVTLITQLAERFTFTARVRDLGVTSSLKCASSRLWMHQIHVQEGAPTLRAHAFGFNRKQPTALKFILHEENDVPNLWIEKLYFTEDDKLEEFGVCFNSKHIEGEKVPPSITIPSHSKKRIVCKETEN